MTRLCLTGFNLMTPDSYFTILVENFKNHILAENTYFMNHIEWTEHKIMVLKPTNKCQIISQCHNFKKHSYRWFPASFISLSSRSLWKSLFFEAENGKLLSHDYSPFKLLFTIWFTQVPEMYLLKLC